MKHWKPEVVKMPSLSVLVAPEVVVTTTYSVTSDDKVGIMTNPGFHVIDQFCIRFKIQWFFHERVIEISTIFPWYFYFSKFQVLFMKFNDFSMILKQSWVSLIFQELWEPCTFTFATTPDKSVQDKLPILISCGFHTWCETHKKSKLATVVTTNKFIMNWNWTLSSRL